GTRPAGRAGRPDRRGPAAACERGGGVLGRRPRDGRRRPRGVRARGAGRQRAPAAGRPRRAGRPARPRRRGAGGPAAGGRRGGRAGGGVGGWAGVAGVVDAVPGSDAVAGHGLFAVYRPDSGPVPLGSHAGGILDLDTTGLEGQLRRRIQTDAGTWAWDGLAVP